MTEQILVAPEPPAAPLRPVASSERIELLDILRGVALFGILAANIRGFAGPAAAYFEPQRYWSAFHDRIAQAFIDTFIQGKFINIFAFLFGAGFAVQFDRASSRAGSFGKTYARRLGVLLLFGLVHGVLIWWGDILVAYALIGFLLLLFRKREDKTIARWSAAWLLTPIVIMSAFFVSSQFATTPPPFPVATQAELTSVSNVMSGGSWAEIESQRFSDVKTYNWSFLPIFGLQVLGLFLAGVYAWRKRFFTPSPESLPRYRRAMFWGLSIGLTWNVLVSVLRWVAEPPIMASTFWELALWSIATLATPALSLGYVCLVILLVYTPAWHERLRIFAPLGRTALTNYLLQSIIGTTIFYGYGLGLFGRFGPAALIPMTIVLYTAQVYASRWWLTRYRFGPAEWLWRRMTYGGPLPMRKEAAITTATSIEAA
jgi:uncharacterized protein